MDTDGWKAAKELFYDALDLGPEGRAKLLATVDPEVRREVEELLEAQERVQEKAEADEPPRDGPGAKIGRYKLLQEIGEGGFGVVYLAEQTEPVNRRVALKIIKVGMDTKQVIARFEAERQALAILDHPNIAKVLDAGTTDTGRPYFVMELVKGIPITEYCDQASLDTKERLHLFTSVCRAIQHAHQKGIIHRDLKPGNVLVTLHDGTPVPKVIDFGIAKATDRHLTEKTLFTEYRQIVGTPEYMAPEQAAFSGLDVDTRADVYSLGVLLYELLTGTKPFDLTTLAEQGWNEILRMIREVDPPRPSTKLSTMGDDLTAVAKHRHTEPGLLGRLMKGDLDWIVMKALEKDRTRRYDTAEGLAQDVERYLDDLPVEASPPSAVYRLRKYVKRNKAGVIASVAVVLALLAGVVFSTMGFLEARKQRAEAVAERDGANQARTAEAQAREAAELAATEAQAERDEKEAARAELAGALRHSEGVRLLAQSQLAVTRDPSLALLLAIEGAERAPGLQANQALLAAIAKTPQREFVLDGGRVWDAAFSPDSRRVATAHADGTIRVRDTQSGQTLRTLQLGETPVVKLAWTPENGRIVGVASDGRIGAWNAATYESLRSLLPDDEERRLQDKGRAEISRDGKRALLVYYRDEALAFDIERGTVIDRLPMTTFGDVRLSPTGTALLVMREPRGPGQFRQVDLRDLETGEERAVCSSSHRTPRPRFSPDGAHVLVALAGRKLGLFDGATAAALHDLEPRRDVAKTEALAAHGFSRDGRHVWAHTGRWIWIWDAETGRESDYLGGIQPWGELIVSEGAGRVCYLERTPVPTLKINCLQSGAQRLAMPLGYGAGRYFVSPDDRCFLTMGFSGEGHLWRPGRDPTLLNAWGGRNLVPMDADGRRYVSAAMEARPPRIWDVAARRPVLHLDAHRGSMNDSMVTWHLAPAIAVSPDGRRIVTGSMFGDLALWDSATGRQILEWKGHEGPIWDIAFSADGRRILSAAQDETARVWDAASGQPLLTLGEVRPHGQGPRGPVWLINGRLAVFSPRGDRVLTRLREGVGVQVWNATDGSLLFDCREDDGDPKGAQFTVDEKAIIVTWGTLDGFRTSIYDGDSGDRRLQLAGSSVMGAGSQRATSLDGKHLLLCVADEGVAVHEVDSGTRVQMLPFAEERLLSAWYDTSDGHIAAQTASGARVLVWSIQTGDLVLDLDHQSNVTPSVPFTPDGHILVRRSTGFARIPLDPLPLARAVAPRALTGPEREQYGLPASAGEGTRAPAMEGVAPGDLWAGEDRVAEEFELAMSAVFDDPEALKEPSRLLRNEVRSIGLAPVALVRSLQVLGAQAVRALEWQRAEHFHRIAHRRARAEWGPDHPTTRWALHYLARACLRSGKHAEAETLSRRWLEAWGAEKDDFRTSTHRMYLAASVLAQGRAEEAEPLLREAIELAIRDYGEAHHRVQEARSWLGACLAAQGRRDEAEPLLLRGFQAMRAPKSAGHLPVEAVARLVAFYEEGGEPEKAAEWRRHVKPEVWAKLAPPADDGASDR